MTDPEILVILKLDLDICTGSRDEYLSHLVQLARQKISEEGITIRNDVPDGMLVEAYAAHLHRTRKNPAPMPRMLRWMLNNRLMSEKGSEADG